MDLSSMLNDEGRERSSRPAPGPPHPAQSRPGPPHPRSLPQQPQPATPGQQMPPRAAFHPASHQPQPSPTRQISQEFPPHHYAGSPPPPGHYPPPGASPGAYPTRPAPPPLQPAGPNVDPRSPVGAVPLQSPYRQSSSATAYGGAYPFPTAPAPQSPSQRHQYPHSAGPIHPRDGFSHQQQPQPPTLIGAPGPTGPNYPQTPPVINSHHPQQQHQQQAQPQPPHPQQSYAHQRSQSTHSTTPTSAHSQHHYGQGPAAPFPPSQQQQQQQQQVSPVLPNHPIPTDYPRQPSQPPTPLGPPLSAGHRQSSSTAGLFGPPTSPYQARASVSMHPQVQASPPPPQPQSIPRMASSHGVAYESPTQADEHRRSQSYAHSDRGRSVSVSPKTRAPSIPAPAAKERAVTPAKRKLEEVDEVENQRDAQRPAVDINGSAVPPHLAPAAARAEDSPEAAPAGKRRPHNYQGQTPVWSHMHDGTSPLNNGNWSLHRRGPKSEQGDANGTAGDEQQQEQQQPQQVPQEQRNNQSVPPPDAGPGPGRNPWDPSIAGHDPPVSDMSRMLADFLFINVVSHPDIGEITSRGIQFEIEAKLGKIIDRHTNQRIELPVRSECVIEESSQNTFVSCLNEVEHAKLNSYFNGLVVETEPRNPNCDKRRLRVEYAHTREADKSYELPAALRTRLPPCVERLLPARWPVKVRVSRAMDGGKEGGKGELRAIIIKARVANWHLHFPGQPVDCRVSVNLEMPWDGPVDEVEGWAVAGGGGDGQRERGKDRVSYRQGVARVDLTQVTSGQGQKEHELEIELDPVKVIEYGRELVSGRDPKMYMGVVGCLLENVRVIAHKVGDIRDEMERAGGGR